MTYNETIIMGRLDGQTVVNSKIINKNVAT